MKKIFSISKILEAIGNKPEINLNPIEDNFEPETVLDKIREHINYEIRENGHYTDTYYLTNTDYEELIELLGDLKVKEYPHGYRPYYELDVDDQKIPGIVGQYYGVRLVKRY